MAYKAKDISGFEDVLDWEVDGDSDALTGDDGKTSALDPEKKNKYFFLVFLLLVFFVLCGAILYLHGPEMFKSLKAAKWFTFITLWLSVYSYAHGKT